MTTLLDIAELKERVTVRGQQIDVAGISAEGIAALLYEFPELRAMMTAAEAVVYAALGRAESRGAHQREDFPLADYQLIKNQVLELRDGELVCRWAQPVRLDRSQLEKPLMP